jgi:hypothetical protein
MPQMLCLIRFVPTTVWRSPLPTQRSAQAAAQARGPARILAGESLGIDRIIGPLALIAGFGGRVSDQVDRLALSSPRFNQFAVQPINALSCPVRALVFGLALSRVLGRPRAALRGRGVLLVKSCREKPEFLGNWVRNGLCTKALGQLADSGFEKFREPSRHRLQIRVQRFDSASGLQ